MFDKYELIDSIIIQINKVFDLHGAERAVVLIDAIQRLKALKDGLTEDDKNNINKIEALKKQHKAQIKELTDGCEDIGSQEFHIGVDGTVTQTEE